MYPAPSSWLISLHKTVKTNQTNPAHNERRAVDGALGEESSCNESRYRFVSGGRFILFRVFFFPFFFPPITPNQKKNIKKTKNTSGGRGHESEVEHNKASASPERRRQIVISQRADSGLQGKLI